MTGWLPDGTETWGGRPVARAVAEVAPRRRAVLTGVLESVRRLAPDVGSPSVEADLRDATGTVGLCWLGRDGLPGIVPGTLVTVEGTATQRRNRLVLLNPLYRFVEALGPDVPR